MNKRIGNANNRIINITGLTVILIMVATKCMRDMGFHDRSFFLQNSFRTFLFLLFLILWIISVNQRVIQKNIRFILLSVALLELFWIVVRTVRYEVLENEISLRYSWYMYYLPMLLIPALCLILAVAMGKPETDTPKKSLYVFPFFSVILFVFVLTNDIHKTVFTIPKGIEGMETGNYSYGAGYYVIAIYVGLCVLASYGIMLVKCRVKNGKIKHFLPLIPITIGTCLGVIYIVNGAILFGFYHLDISLIICLATTFTLEACMQSRLILTNSGYDELFKICGISTLITDKDFHPIITSESYSEITPENMRKAGDKPVMLKDGIRLSSVQVKDGYVFWQDDVSELEHVLNELSGVNDYLSGKNATIRQAYSYKKKERQLIEKNRLYNRILSQTKPEIELYADLIEQLDKETDQEREKEIAVKIAFVSTFIKRRDNLIFLCEEDKPIAPAELYYCVEESLSALGLSGVLCLCSYKLDKPVDFAKASRIYEMFYKSLYDVIEKLSSVCVYLIEDHGEAVLILRVCCNEDEREMTLI